MKGTRARDQGQKQIPPRGRRPVRGGPGSAYPVVDLRRQRSPKCAESQDDTALGKQEKRTTWKRKENGVQAERGLGNKDLGNKD
jgi:hypothetical protein